MIRDAALLTYSPNAPADWTNEPGLIDEALDEIARRQEAFQSFEAADSVGDIEVTGTAALVALATTVTSMPCNAPAAA